MKKRCILLFLSLTIAASGGGETPKYGWPLPFDNGVSSTFQEFRGNHFHAGVDLRTYQMTGFPVLAVEDGVVFRLRLVKNDSGRALYLRHADGNTSVYFHLERYSDELEAIARRVQAERGAKYFGNYELEKPVAFRRGDCIAFSGETGSGLPHLHVEIRDPEWRALNPFPLIDFPNADPYAPIPRGVLVKTCGDSLIDGECGEFYLPLARSEAGYALEKPFQLQGTFDPVLHVTDITYGGKFCGLYAVRALLDGKPVFELQFDRFGWEDNNQLGFVYDMFRCNGGSDFLNLFSQPGFEMERSRVSLHQALMDLAPGEHELHLNIVDFFLNSSDVAIPFVKVAPDAAAGDAARAAASSLHLLRRAEVEYYVNRDDLVLKLGGVSWPAEQAKLRAIQGNQEIQLPAQESRSGLFFRFKPLNRESRLDLRLQFWNENRLVGAIQKVLTVAVLVPETTAAVQLGEMRVDFAPRSVREPKLVWLRKAEKRYRDGGYPVLVEPFELQPFDLPFLDEVWVRLRPAGSVADPRQVGIFRYNAHRRSWAYVPTVQGGNLFSTRILSPGVFALLRDVYKPEIRMLSRRRQPLAECGQLFIRIRDRGKGVDDDTLRVAINGMPIDAEYDPDRDWVKIESPPGLKSGANFVQVAVADRAGNRSGKRFKLFLL